ncbi:hypothetical protein DYB36_012369 [Aphanomyces astaci]|uniref:Rab-GAP TBC domain-containing protein n=1 Tax=Aphanomyces astaci TaxID=112090 RepID=A0A397BDR3_APHAT|nr:hypothetical protein DYB36_012369 [Aphanomyces astaci]
MAANLPRLRAGRLLLEVQGMQRKWESYIVALVGTDITNLTLCYYKDAADKLPTGMIHLHSASVDLMEEVFCVITLEQTWYLCADTPHDAEEWVDLICTTLEAAAMDAPFPSHADPPASSNIGDGGSRRRRLSSHITTSTVQEIQSRDMSTRVDEFLEMYVRSDEADIRSQAARGALSWSCLRNITWRLWLGCLPMDAPLGEWVDITTRHRRRYDQLRAKHVPRGLCGHDEDSKGLPVVIYDEASSFLTNDLDDHPTEKRSEDEVAHMIWKDVRRTRCTMQFFQNDRIQRTLLHVLLVYAAEHPTISYNQGMGELLAVLVYLLHVERWSSPSPDVAEVSNDDESEDSYVHVDMVDVDTTNVLDATGLLQMRPFAAIKATCTTNCKHAVATLLATLMDDRFLEHDAFALFEQVMERMAPMFCPHATSCDRRGEFSPRRDDSSLLQAQCDHIHNVLLRRVDPVLAAHVHSFHIPPEVYLLRWLRLLLAREFPMYQVWVIWDSIFGLSPTDFAFVDMLCVAMLHDSRMLLLAQDDTTGLLHALKELGGSHSKLVESARKMHTQHQLDALYEHFQQR